MLLVAPLTLLPLGQETGSGDEVAGECERTELPSIVFVKLFKCASTTAGSVARSIAARYGLFGARWEHKWMLREPGVWATHGSMADERTPPSWGRLAGLGLG